MTDHYAVLGAQPSDSLAALRQRYRARLVSLHPDHNPSPRAHEDFCRLQTAWETLRDPNKRIAYDLARGSRDPTVWREVPIDCLRENHHGHLTFDCRCGEAFVVDPDDLDELPPNLLVPCDGCSLHIRVVPR